MDTAGWEKGHRRNDFVWNLRENRLRTPQKVYLIVVELFRLSFDGIWARFVAARVRIYGIMSEAPQDESAKSRAASPPSSEVAPPLLSNTKGIYTLTYLSALR